MTDLTLFNFSAGSIVQFFKQKFQLFSDVTQQIWQTSFIWKSLYVL